jgi:hypothetical protein
MLYSKCVGHLLKLQCKDFLTTQNAYAFYQVLRAQSCGFPQHYLQSYQKISLKRRYLYYGMFSVSTEQGGARGGAVVEALSYKPQGSEIDSRRCHWNFH